jgi:uncharacterized membrane protein HdeD (DUF308 family)
METKRSFVQRSNPLRSDISWELILVQGLIVLGIGIYALTAEDSARRNIVFVIGLFLLVNGLMYAVGGLRERGASGTMAQFRLIRAGISIVTGLLVVLDRFVDFMGVDPARVVAGIGLVGIGIVSLVGIVMAREAGELFPFGAIASAILLALWGVVILYQATTDDSMTRLLGWVAVIAGVALLGLAWFRRQRSLPPTAPVSA